MRGFVVASLIAVASGALRGPIAPADPCETQAGECSELECPASAKPVNYPGHCCPYCEVFVKVKDATDYESIAQEAYNSFETADYAGGYKTGKYQVRPLHSALVQKKN